MVRNTLMTLSILSFGRRLMSMLALLAVAACAGPTWDGKVYHGGSVSFRVGRVPPGWRKLEDDDSLLTFRDAARDMVVSVNGRCGKDGEDVPLEALTQHLFIYFTERQITDQRRINLDGREALRTELSAKLDGVARRFVVCVLKKDGCVYDFILIAAPSLDPDSKAEFDQFVNGFSAGRSQPGDRLSVQVQP